MKKTIVFKEDLFPNVDSKKLHIKTNNPFGKLRKSMKSLLKGILEINTAKFWEKTIKWDITDGSFYALWKAWRNEDEHTKTIVEVEIYGVQDLKTKDGYVNIKIKGYLQIKYSYRNSLEKSLWFLYNFFFYKNWIRKVWIESRKDVEEIEEAIKKLLGVSKESPYITSDNPHIVK